jgi:hypothetical protein
MRILLPIEILCITHSKPQIIYSQIKMILVLCGEGLLFYLYYHATLLAHHTFQSQLYILESVKYAAFSSSMSVYYFIPG